MFYFNNENQVCQVQLQDNFIPLFYNKLRSVSTHLTRLPAAEQVFLPLSSVPAEKSQPSSWLFQENCFLLLDNLEKVTYN